MKQVRAQPEWKEFMEKGAFNQTALIGDDYVTWLNKEEKRHEALMKEAGFLAK
jgi:tripartite-type tricarboxylate transporter receptor subunit TctC